MKRFLLALAILAVCLPAALVATILLLPLWSWIESRTGIESVGHSGPAEWCYAAVYALLIAVSLGVLWRRRTGSRDAD